MTTSRLSGKITNLAEDWQVLKLTDVPACFTILRIRFDKTTGPAEALAFRIIEVDSETPDTLDIPLEYSLMTLPVDIFPDHEIVVKSGQRSTRLNNQGAIWIAMKADSGTTTTGRFSIDIQAD